MIRCKYDVCTVRSSHSAHRHHIARNPPSFCHRPHITAATYQEEPPTPRITRFLVCALAVLLVLVGTFGVAAAEQRGPTVTPPHANYGELEQLYRLRQLQVRSLYEMLSRDERRGIEVDKLIAYAKSRGVDTAALEQALATYRTMLRHARASWKIAANVLKTHAGFNDAGQVTNPDQARATLKTAENAIYKCYRVARYAEELLNRALAEFRGRK